MKSWNSRPASSAPLPPHPFYPLELQLVGYLPNDWDIPTLVATFFAGWAVVLGVTDVVAGRLNPDLRGWNRALVLWFVLCVSSSSRCQAGGWLMGDLAGTIHFWFEGYFALNHARMVTMSDFFGQLWKEYALADSRYMSSDSFTLCMETITAASLTCEELLDTILIST